MDVIAAIKKRRSIRKFEKKSIPNDVLQQVMECAVLAPSAGNRQPWIFHVVKDQGIKQKLVKAAGGQTFLGDAPVVVVISGDPEVSAKRYGDRGRSLYYIQDTAAAVTNIILAATSFELGTCWVGAFRETLVSQALGLPENLRPLAMVPMGYPAEKREPRGLRPFAEIVLER